VEGRMDERCKDGLMSGEGKEDVREMSRVMV
jgi:hypothetical protein